jgi:serine/threonine protein phosphatase PrpC
MSHYEYHHKAHQGTRSYQADVYRFVQVGKNGYSLVMADGCGDKCQEEGYAAQYFCDSWLNIINNNSQAYNKMNINVFKNCIDVCTQLTAKKLIAGGYIHSKTTFVAIWLDNYQTLIGYIGDTHAYIIHSNDKPFWHTKDHSLEQTLIAAGLVDEHSNRNSKIRHRLLKTVNIDGMVQPTMVVKPALNKNESVMLCTDGFWEHLQEGHIKDIREADNIETVLDNIFLEIIRASDNLDNMTVQIIKKCS